MEQEISSHVSPINIEEEMRQSYMDYAMSVIVGRALPDVRDGLKPVQRRVLYAMYSEGLLSNRKHSKCAGVVGEVLKKFHPHGDMPVYEALVRIAQPWSLRYPLVDGQGNFGSIDGDPPAAYRYTESRMSAVAEQLLADIDKDTVDFIPNFDDTTSEPVVLPTLVPNLLVNGADGIAVGMATHIPPHNLREVVSATIALINNPSISVSELMTHIPGPDFPTGGIIYGQEAIREAYTTGKGIIQIRARTHFEKLKTGTREAEAIIITEVPYQVNKARLVEKIADLVTEKTIEGISKLRDESDRKGMRVVIELKRDATPEIVLNQLFSATPMQTSFGIINLAIVEGRPAVCSLRQLLQSFIDHRRDVTVRRTQFELKQARDRMHLLEGFRIALLNIDEVITIIKKSADAKEARESLIARFELSTVQSQAILDLRLQKLTGMERLAIEKEYEELKAQIEWLLALLGDPKRIDDLIISEVSAVNDKYGDARRTAIEAKKDEITKEDLIEDEEMVVSVTHQGYIKRTAVTEYRAQHRGGKGVAGAVTADDDFIEHLFVASNLSHLLFFTSYGRLYWQKVYQIPEAGRAAKGRAIVNILDFKEGEKLTAILPLKEYRDDLYVVLVTRNGIIKRVNLTEFSRPRQSGIIACALDDGDALIGVAISSGADDILIAAKSGMSIRFPEDDVRVVGRTARGVKAITLEEGDVVVSMTIVSADVITSAGSEVSTDSEAPVVDIDGAEYEAGEVETKLSGPAVLAVCENGFGKRTKISEYRTQSRGGKGIIAIQANERNGALVAALIAREHDDVMMITSSGKIIRIKVAEIGVRGRNTMGVRLINLDEGELVVAVAPVAESESDSETTVSVQ